MIAGSQARSGYTLDPSQFSVATVVTRNGENLDQEVSFLRLNKPIQFREFNVKYLSLFVYRYKCMHFYSILIQLMMINLYIILNVFQNSHCYLLVFGIYGDITIKFSIDPLLASTQPLLGLAPKKNFSNCKTMHVT